LTKSFFIVVSKTKGGTMATSLSGGGQETPPLKPPSKSWTVAKRVLLVVAFAALAVAGILAGVAIYALAG